MKFEKVTLWMCTETYGKNDSAALSALDYVMEALDELQVECKLLGHETEEYKLIPISRVVSSFV